MTKEELLRNIKESRDLNEKFESAHVTDLKTNIAFTEWLDSIEHDLANDIIPERIMTIISHNLDNLKLSDKLLIHVNEHIPYNEENYKRDRLDTILQSLEYKETYNLYRSVGFASKNTVLVGANGSGKTTLANALKKTLDIEDGIVIPAQKLLLVPTFDNIPTYKAEKEPFTNYQKKVLDDKKTFSARNQNDFPYDIAKEYGIEYRTVLALLIAERNHQRNDVIDKKVDGSQFLKSEFRTTIDTVIEIWNDLIPHRTMTIDPDSNLIIRYKHEEEEITYEAYKMSDGERIILYLAGRVMLAPKDGLIIVDEPEIYLHKTVVEKLWNRLEKERNDCIFLYLTHDLQFATSRVGVKSWIKSYEYPSNWDIQLIDENDIPEQLLFELLGSCKNILFCEGTKTTSLDRKIYDILFPDYVIYPLESCKDVINYTKAYNAIPNVNRKAYGLVDSDFRSKEEITDLRSNQIYTYKLAEIENLFLIESFLNSFINYHKWNGDIEKIKNGIISMLDSDKEMQVSNYVSSYVDYYYKIKHVAKGNTPKEVKDKLKAFNDCVDIDDIYKKRMTELVLYIEKKSYTKALAVYNNKGLCSIVEKELGIKDYIHKALDFLRIAPSEVINELRDFFPSELK